MDWIFRQPKKRTAEWLETTGLGKTAISTNCAIGSFPASDIGESHSLSSILKMAPAGARFG